MGRGGGIGDWGWDGMWRVAIMGLIRREGSYMEMEMRFVCMCATMGGWVYNI